MVYKYLSQDLQPPYEPLTVAIISQNEIKVILRKKSTNTGMFYNIILCYVVLCKYYRYEVNSNFIVLYSLW